MGVEPPIRRFLVGLAKVSSYRTDAARRGIDSGYCEVAGDDGSGVKLSCVWRFLRVDFRGWDILID